MWVQYISGSNRLLLYVSTLLKSVVNLLINCVKASLDRNKKKKTRSIFRYFFQLLLMPSLLSRSLFFFFIWIYHHSLFPYNTQQANLGWSQWTARQNWPAYPWAARGASVACSAGGFLTFPLRFPSASGFFALHTIIFILLTNILL